jgi:hypothetical protein
MKSLLSILSILLFGSVLNGQLIGIESSIPPGIDWRQLNTDTVRVVYPAGLESQARRIGGMVHYMAEHQTGSLGEKVRKIDIFLLNKTVESNGYVATPPFHSKFYTQAPQVSFAGTTDWLDLLAIHEYRHVQQMSNALHGPTKWMYRLFGEIGWAGAAHLAAPAWFWEGDAVVQETLLSHSGRGRVPGFGVHLRTIASLEVPFDYEKMVGGSYRDFIPNHYYLGYELALYGRKQYGNRFWRNIYREATNYDGLLWPFSGAIRASTGMRINQLYGEMMKELDWTPSESSVSLLYESSRNPGVPASYSFPRFRDDQQLVVLREDFNRPPVFVLTGTGGEEVPLLKAGYGTGSFDADPDHLVWNERVSHPRWADVSYSNLFLYDFDSGRIRQLTRNTRYFAPSISPCGKRLVAVETEESMQANLVVLDLETGDLTERITLPGNAFLTFPDWLGDTSLVFVAQENSRQSVLRLDLLQRTVDTLVWPQTEMIEHLHVVHGKVYYSTNAAYDKNQLVCLDLPGGEVKRSKLNLVPYLMEMPVVSENGQVAFVNTRFNQKTLAIAREEDIFEYVPPMGTLEQMNRLYQRSSYDYTLLELTGEEGGVLPDTFPWDAREQKYRPGFHKMKWHSWILNPSFPGISLMLQANDALGTSGLYVEPGYNFNEGTFFTNVQLSYGAFYPKFELGLSTLVNRSARFYQEGDYYDRNWDEFVVRSAVQVPLSFTQRHFYYRFNPVMGYRYIGTSGFPLNSVSRFHVGYLSVQAAAFQRSAYTSIKPRFGVDGALSVQKVINNDDQPMFAAGLNLYLPGWYITHSIWFDMDFRYMDKNNAYPFIDQYDYVPGSFPEKKGDWIAGVKAYYGFPLWYPDRSIGSLVFFKRLRMNLNYKLDAFPAYGSGEFLFYQSVGFELVTDARYFRLADQPIGIGIDLGVGPEGFGPLSFRIVLQ